MRERLYMLAAVLLCSLLILTTGCVNSKKVVYFNDIYDTTLVAAPAGLEPVVQKNDLLSINVSSLSPQATQVFNTPNLPTTANGQMAQNMTQAAGYLVDQDGNIKFPMLGNINAAGMTKKRLEEEIAKQLIDKKLLFDPIVNVRYLNFRVTVLGEVNRPGVVSVPSEQITVLEALGQAGDLTIYGKRENVLLVRQEGTSKLVKRLNLNNSDVLTSPYFFLKSNDVIYVEPGTARVAAGTRTQQLLPSILSGVSIIVVVLTSLLK